MKNGKLTHRLSWAIYYFRNKKQKDDKENTSQCIGYCFPPKRVLRGGWANTFWETTHSEEHSPSDVWSCFPSKYQTYLPGVISVFWDFKQISSPTDNPKKIEKTLSTSQHMKCGNYLFRLVGLGTGVICQVLIHPVPSILGHRVKDISIHPEIFPSSTFTFSGLYFGWPFLLILFNTFSIFLYFFKRLRSKQSQSSKGWLNLVCRNYCGLFACFDYNYKQLRKHISATSGSS